MNPDTAQEEANFLNEKKKQHNKRLEKRKKVEETSVQCYLIENLRSFTCPEDLSANLSLFTMCPRPGVASYRSPNRETGYFGEPCRG